MTIPRWFAVLGLLAFAVTARADERQKPAMGRGLNLSCWLSSALRQPLDTRDFQNIRKTGFDHVRLPYNPAAFGYRFRGEEGKLDFTSLDQALSDIRKSGLNVILDMHLLDPDMQAIENDSAAEERLMRIWRQIASRYKSYPTNVLAFELLNEPQYYNKQERYQKLAQKLVETVRSEAPHHLIIVNAAWGASIDGLLQMGWIQDKNLLYAFHYYLPYIITHQGIHMGEFNGEPIRYLQKVPYPASLLPKDIEIPVYAPQAPEPSKVIAMIEKYRNEGWGKQKVREQIKRAADWSAKYKVGIICTEFGVLKTKINPDSRYRWISDTRQSLEEFGIGWSMWDYTDLFGIVKLTGETSVDPVDHSERFKGPARGKREFEPEALTALGIAP